MVEHAWVRIAELKADAELEEWEAAHPLRTRLRRLLKWLRIRLLIRLKEFQESERGARLMQTAHGLKLGGATSLLRLYFAVTRCGGCRPARARALRLSTRQLVEELDARGIERSGCVERSDLLDALCGEADAFGDADAEGVEDTLIPPTPVDKMV